MARIIENETGRRNVILTEDDVLSIVREYQAITCGIKSYEEIREVLKENKFYLPEDLA